jgi:hypothetical protein
MFTAPVKRVVPEIVVLEIAWIFVTGKFVGGNAVG